MPQDENPSSEETSDAPVNDIKGVGDLHLVRLVEQRLGSGFVFNCKQLPSGEFAEVKANDLLEVLRFLRLDPDADLELLIDLSCIDRLSNTPAEPRFEVFYVLRSSRLPYQISLHLYIDEASPELPSITSLYPAADWLERELWDSYGLYVDGHPHLRRILLYPGFTSHPMLRDYPAAKTQPQVPLRPASRPTVVVDVAGNVSVSSKDTL